MARLVLDKANLENALFEGRKMSNDIDSSEDENEIIPYEADESLVRRRIIGLSLDMGLQSKSSLI